MEPVPAIEHLKPSLLRLSQQPIRQPLQLSQPLLSLLLLLSLFSCSHPPLSRLSRLLQPDLMSLFSQLGRSLCHPQAPMQPCQLCCLKLPCPRQPLQLRQACNATTLSQHKAAAVKQAKTRRFQLVAWVFLAASRLAATAREANLTENRHQQDLAISLQSATKYSIYFFLLCHNLFHFESMLSRPVCRDMWRWKWITYLNSMPLRLLFLSSALDPRISCNSSAITYALILPLKGQLSFKRETKEMMTMTQGVIGPM